MQIASKGISLAMVSGFLFSISFITPVINDAQGADVVRNSWCRGAAWGTGITGGGNRFRSWVTIKYNSQARVFYFEQDRSSGDTIGRRGTVTRITRYRIDYSIVGSTSIAEVKLRVDYGGRDSKADEYATIRYTLNRISGADSSNCSDLSRVHQGSWGSWTRSPNT